MEAYIVGGYRSAIGKAPRGGFRFTRPDDIAAAVIRHLMKDFPCKTKNGDTPLIFAVRHGLIDIVKLLIEKGADVNARNPETARGKTALMIAREKGHAGIIDILETSGAGSD